MTLSDYLSETGTTPTALAREIGVSSESIARYRDGERIPAKDIMVRIVEATNGRVTPNDFYPVPPSQGHAA